jgi:hypothetical protein
VPGPRYRQNSSQIPGVKGTGYRIQIHNTDEFIMYLYSVQAPVLYNNRKGKKLITGVGSAPF